MPYVVQVLQLSGKWLDRFEDEPYSTLEEAEAVAKAITAEFFTVTRVMHGSRSKAVCFCLPDNPEDIAYPGDRGEAARAIVQALRRGYAEPEPETKPEAKPKQSGPFNIVFEHGGKNEFRHATSESLIELKQSRLGKKLFTLTYGLQVYKNLPYDVACVRLGAALLHFKCCEGLADNDGSGSSSNF